MGDLTEVRCDGRLLFVLNRATGKIELLRDGWLYTVDVTTLAHGRPIVDKKYMGKCKVDVLTNVDKCAIVTHSN